MATIPIVGLSIVVQASALDFRHYRHSQSTSINLTSMTLKGETMRRPIFLILLLAAVGGGTFAIHAAMQKGKSRGIYKSFMAEGHTIHIRANGEREVKSTFRRWGNAEGYWREDTISSDGNHKRTVYCLPDRGAFADKNGVLTYIAPCEPQWKNPSMEFLSGVNHSMSPSRNLHLRHEVPDGDGRTVWEVTTLHDQEVDDSLFELPNLPIDTRLAEEHAAKDRARGNEAAARRLEEGMRKATQ